MTLDEVLIDCFCVVTKVNLDGIMRRRVMDIGIVPGTVICPVLDSFSGDPCAYLVKGSVVALRKSDASLIEVSML